MEKAYLEDEVTRYKQILSTSEKREYWRRKCIEEDEKGIEIVMQPIPKYERKKIEFSLAGAVGLAGTMIKSLIP